MKRKVEEPVPEPDTVRYKPYLQDKNVPSICLKMTADASFPKDSTNDGSARFGAHLNPLEDGEKDERNNDVKKGIIDENNAVQLKRFASHCRSFFLASLSLPPSSSSSSLPSDEDVIFETKHSKSILDALEHYSSFGSIDEMRRGVDCWSDSFHEELKACGLEQLPDNIQQYIDIRQEERTIAHEMAMKRRHEVLLSNLPNENAHDIHDEDDDDHISIMVTRGHIRRSKQFLRTFVHKYYEDISSHSFMAGLRKFIETQLKNSHTVGWTFESTILSEHQESYCKDAIHVLSLCANFVPKNHDVDLEQNNTNENIMQLSWEMNHFISDDALQQLLSQLPTNFDMRPKGKVHVIDGQNRQNKKGHLDEWGLAIDGVLGYCDIL